MKESATEREKEKRGPTTQRPQLRTRWKESNLTPAGWRSNSEKTIHVVAAVPELPCKTQKKLENKVIRNKSGCILHVTTWLRDALVWPLVHCEYVLCSHILFYFFWLALNSVIWSPVTGDYFKWLHADSLRFQENSSLLFDLSSSITSNRLCCDSLTKNTTAKHTLVPCLITLPDLDKCASVVRVTKKKQRRNKQHMRLNSGDSFPLWMSVIQYDVKSDSKKKIRRRVDK